MQYPKKMNETPEERFWRLYNFHSGKFDEIARTVLQEHGLWEEYVETCLKWEDKKYEYGYDEKR